MAILSPVSEFVRYLAIFHRAFAAIERYGCEEDWEGAYCSGWLANALHNAPDVALNYHADQWYTPARINEIFTTFPSDMAEREVSDRLIRDYQHIFSAPGAAAELGLLDDLSDLSLPPLQKARHYADFLRMTFVLIRLIRNQGGSKSQAWNIVQEEWSERACEIARANARLARAILPLPAGLAHWATFDEVAFFDHAITLASELPEADRPQWLQYFESDKQKALALSSN